MAIGSAIIARSRKRQSPLAHASKISDYRLRKVIGHFVRDHTATDAARATGLSINSANALYQKLRAFFCEVRLFTSYYDRVRVLGDEAADAAFEQELLAFHRQRSAAKRGLKTPLGEPDYHFAETCWRYDFIVIMRERPSEAVYAMMERHLIELIRLCGPLGSTPRNRLAGAKAAMRQVDERIAWLLRNAPGFRSSDQRRELADALAITETNE